MNLNGKKFKTTTHGTAAAPLSLAVAQQAMLQYPDGTKFLYMICAVTGGMGVTAAHWVYAEKAAGAITWTDYQTDIPTNDARHTRYVARAGHAQQGVLGRPNQQAAPMRAFGEDADAGDRAVVIALGRHVWQAAVPTVPPVIGGHRG